MSLVPATLRERAERWLNDRPDDSVLQWLFRVMLTVTVAVLVLDFVDLNGRVAEQAAASPGSARRLFPRTGPSRR